MGRKTPTKEQKQWIKNNGYTEKQIDAFLGRLPFNQFGN